MLQYAVLRQTRVHVDNGIVSIVGTVHSFYERQLAIACVQRVAGVREVLDRLSVEHPL